MSDTAKKKPAVASFFDQTTYTITHVVSDPTTKAAVIIDSVMNYDPISGRLHTKGADEVIAHVTKHNLNILWHLETHIHADHISAAPYLQEKLGGKLAIGEKIIEVQELFGTVFNAGTAFARDGSQFDKLWQDGEEFMLGDIPVTVLHTPGHTPADVTYVIGDAAFVGDTLFMPDYGSARCDFPGGDAKTLYQSVQKLYELPQDMRLFMCHDYLPEGRKEYAWETNVEDEKTQNIHLKTSVTEGDFVAMRTSRDATLSMPRLIIPSIQVNMRAGSLPPAEDNGVSYLKTPVNGAFVKTA